MDYGNEGEKNSKLKGQIGRTRYEESVWIFIEDSRAISLVWC